MAMEISDLSGEIDISNTDLESQRKRNASNFS